MIEAVVRGVRVVCWRRGGARQSAAGLVGTRLDLSGAAGYAAHATAVDALGFGQRK